MKPMGCYKRKLVLVPVAVLLLGAACSRVEDKGSTTMADLERTLEHRQEYVEKFERQMDSVKRAVPADADDSVLWEHAYEMYEIYRYFNIDTVGRYVRKCSRLAARTGDPDQISLSDGARVRWMRSVTANYGPALELFESMDTVGLKKTTIRKYYSVGVSLFMELVQNTSQNDPRYPEYAARLKRLRQEYEEKFFDTSVHCRIMTALACRDYGDYDRALTILEDLYRGNQLTTHVRSQVMYYITTVYRLQGRMEERRDLLIRTANLELQIPIRDYHSMYDLALVLFEEKDFQRASEFISITYADAFAINFNSRIRRASKAQNTIAHSAYESERQRIRMTNYSLLLLGVALAIVSGLFLYSMRQRRRLHRSYSIVASMNDKLEKSNEQLARANSELKDANLIKDSYVSRYMKLSAYYIRQVDEVRKEIKRAGKSGGLDAVMAILRSPRYADEESKRFYRIFDETFMGLYPHFVDKVNELMPEDSRYTRRPDGGLNTELRVLAFIRLGVTKSQEIAEVLNCSVKTVYKYRETLRQKSLCPKEDFENIIARIDF